MRILISGATGLIGPALTSEFAAAGDEVVPLVRNPAPGSSPKASWRPDEGVITLGDQPYDAVVHLAGENIAGRRWSAAQKELIRASRVQGTRLLAEALARSARPPGVLLCASAIGYYGDRGDEWLTEDSPAGSGFLPEVCRQWEAAADPARQAGIRVVHLRFGLVLSSAGGPLAKMLLPFRMGMGGRVGHGRQFMSWITPDDVRGIVRHCLAHDDLHGPLNAVTPNPVTNAEFTRTLGRVLHKPTIMTMPAAAARLAFGQMADDLLLASTRVRPARLEATHYAFRHPDLEAALRHLLDRPQA